ncbi:ArnT family glycosyltransferase [Hyphomicrobium sp. DY-1]|uniref:ArnT family glycosyltransferase n=1 Tax=Hyphomicrobium sp. DY-1 TaxID=3075650 RepID=UPI0039C4C6FD
MSDEIVGLAQAKGWRALRLPLLAQHSKRIFKALAHRSDAIVLIIALALIVSVPQSLLHGYHYVEGLTVTVAQSALDDGNWFNQHMYNLRWIERPMLLSWVIAALSMPFGQVFPFIARLPVVLSLVAGTVLIWRAVRPNASPEAAGFGALLFLACPLVMRYYVTSVADLPLAVLLFGAFLVWWNAYVADRLTVGRWIIIGAILAIAALMKGPQPTAYFFLGIFVFLSLTSGWRQLPGLILAGFIATVPTALWYAHVFVAGDQGEWLRYTRLSSNGVVWPHPFANGADFFFECLPAAMLAAALPFADFSAMETKPRRHFILAVSCYGLTCTLVVLFWPAEVNPRYILPAVLPLCVLGGVAFDALSKRMAPFVATAGVLVAALLGYAIYHSMSDVFLTPGYIRSEVDGAKIATLVKEAPGPVYRTGWHVALNELPYVHVPVMTITPNQIAKITRPAWLVAPETDARAMLARSHGLMTSVLAFNHFALLRLN